MPAQRFASCQGCTLSLSAAALRAIARIIWAYEVGPTLATLGYVTGGTLGATACGAATCVTTWVTYSALAAIPGITRTLALLGRLKRAWGRVSPLISPGSPPPWDTSTIFTRRSDYIHRPNWEGRFAGARRTCYSHLVSAMSQWHLPWWLLVLALQWAVVCHRSSSSHETATTDSIAAGAVQLDHSPSPPSPRQTHTYAMRYHAMRCDSEERGPWSG